MLRSDRGERSKAWIKVALIAAVVAAFVIVAGAFTHSKYQQNATDQAEKYARDTRDPQIYPCVAVPNLGGADCLAQRRHAERENERQEQDLYAQKATALWTAIMGSAAVIGMMLSAVGVFLVYTTFNATREGNKIARDSFAMSYKPWLMPKITGIYIPARDFQPTIPVANEARRFPINAGLAAQNIGDMPATIIGYQITMEMEHPNFNISRDMEGERFEIVGKGEEKTLLPDHNLVATFIFDHAIRVGFIMDKPPIIGHIDYLDTTGRRYRLGFGFKPISVSEPGYVRWGGPEVNYDRAMPE